MAGITLSSSRCRDWDLSLSLPWAAQRRTTRPRADRQPRPDRLVPGPAIRRRWRCAAAQSLSSFPRHAATTTTRPRGSVYNRNHDDIPRPPPDRHARRRLPAHGPTAHDFADVSHVVEQQARSFCPSQVAESQDDVAALELSFLHRGLGSLPDLVPVPLTRNVALRAPRYTRVLCRHDTKHSRHKSCPLKTLARGKPDDIDLSPFCPQRTL